MLSSLVSGSNQQPAQVESAPGCSTVEPSPSRVERRGEEGSGEGSESERGSSEDVTENIALQRRRSTAPLNINLSPESRSRQSLHFAASLAIVGDFPYFLFCSRSFFLFFLSISFLSLFILIKKYTIFRFARDRYGSSVHIRATMP